MDKRQMVSLSVEEMEVIRNMRIKKKHIEEVCDMEHQLDILVCEFKEMVDTLYKTIHQYEGDEQDDLMSWDTFRYYERIKNEM